MKKSLELQSNCHLWDVFPQFSLPGRNFSYCCPKLWAAWHLAPCPFLRDCFSPVDKSTGAGRRASLSLHFHRSWSSHGKETPCRLNLGWGLQWNLLCCSRDLFLNPNTFLCGLSNAVFSLFKEGCRGFAQSTQAADASLPFSSSLVPFILLLIWDAVVLCQR